MSSCGAWGSGVCSAQLKLTVCGLPFALSLTVRLAARDPAAAGVNVTLIVQFALTAKEIGRASCRERVSNSAALVPVIAILFTVNTPGPLFVSVTLCAALVVLVV